MWYDEHMLKNILISSVIFLASCGDNIVVRPDGSSADPDRYPEVGIPENPELDPNGGDGNERDCGVDGSGDGGDGGDDSDDDDDDDLDGDTKAACCNALTHTTSIPHECGVPPGQCNGTRKFLCGSNTFVLCKNLL